MRARSKAFRNGPAENIRRVPAHRKSGAGSPAAFSPKNTSGRSCRKCSRACRSKPARPDSSARTKSFFGCAASLDIRASSSEKYVSTWPSETSCRLRLAYTPRSACRRARRLMSVARISISQASANFKRIAQCDRDRIRFFARRTSRAPYAQRPRVLPEFSLLDLRAESVSSALRKPPDSGRKKSPASATAPARRRIRVFGSRARLAAVPFALRDLFLVQIFADPS